MNATPTLYEWAGGTAAIRRLMGCFYDRVERDELLSPYFPGGVSEEHRAHVAAWWSEVPRRISASASSEHSSRRLTSTSACAVPALEVERGS